MQPFESVAVTVKVNVPGVVGVPEITPPLVSGDKPVGRAPVVTLKVYGPVPPVAVKVWLYAIPAVPCGKGGAGKRLIDGQTGALMTIV